MEPTVRVVKNHRLVDVNILTPYTKYLGFATEKREVWFFRIETGCKRVRLASEGGAGSRLHLYLKNAEREMSPNARTECAEVVLDFGEDYDDMEVHCCVDDSRYDIEGFISVYR